MPENELAKAVSTLGGDSSSRSGVRAGVVDNLPVVELCMEHGYDESVDEGPSPSRGRTKRRRNSFERMTQPSR